jgi:uncharacterized glyoxalase superfamily protein PhnB
MQSVEPRIDVVTLAVADLERALAFYRDGLGFSTSGRPAQSGEFSLGWLVESRAEVDELLARAEAAGATVMAVADRPWRIYSG